MLSWPDRSTTMSRDVGRVGQSAAAAAKVDPGCRAIGGLCPLGSVKYSR